MTDLQWGQLALMVTTAGGFIVQSWRENRNRHWATEDRAVAAAIAKQERVDELASMVAVAKAEAEALKIKTTAIAESMRVETAANIERARTDAIRATDHLAEKAAAMAESVRAQTIASTAHLEASIADVHKVATEAFTEANHVNNKISDLNQRLLSQGTREEEANAAKTVQLTGIDGEIRELADRQQTNADINSTAHAAHTRRLTDMDVSIKDIEEAVTTKTPSAPTYRGPERRTQTGGRKQ